MHISPSTASLFLASLLQISCSGTPGESTRLALNVITPSDVDENPYRDLVKLEFVMSSHGSTVCSEQVDFSESKFKGDALILNPVEFDLERRMWDNLRLSLKGWKLGPEAKEIVFSRGQTEIFDLSDQAEKTVSLYFSPAGRFSTPGTMKYPRFGHTASLLPDGRVLIVGGASGGIPGAPESLVEHAETYCPQTAKFEEIDGTTIGRIFHTATVLDDGSVLIYGGLGNDGEVMEEAVLFHTDDNSFMSLELDPTRGPRLGHTASLLPSGVVVISGGASSFPVGSQTLDTAFCIDPVSGDTSPVQNAMIQPRAFHRDVPTGNYMGEVFLIGGVNAEGALDTVECYSSAVNSFREISPSEEGVRKNMLDSRVGHSSTLLSDSSIFIAGGSEVLFGGGDSLLSVEVFSQELEGLIDMEHELPGAREWHTATVLDNGRVVISGGWILDQGARGYPKRAELLDPDDKVSTPHYDCSFLAIEDSISHPRALHTATLLLDGTVLLVGGICDLGVVGEAETYNPEFPGD